MTDSSDDDNSPKYSEYVINPLTNRKIKRFGMCYDKLVKNGDIKCPYQEKLKEEDKNNIKFTTFDKLIADLESKELLKKKK